MPIGSRMAIRWVGVRSTNEYAPVRRDMALRNLLAQFAPGEEIASLPITSLSEVVSKLTPCCSSSMRKGTELVMLPLCPRAIQPRAGSCRRKGWALAIRDEPVGEYRVGR